MIICIDISKLVAFKGEQLPFLALLDAGKLLSLKPYLSIQIVILSFMLAAVNVEMRYVNNDGY